VSVQHGSNAFPLQSSTSTVNYSKERQEVRGMDPRVQGIVTLGLENCARCPLLTGETLNFKKQGKGMILIKKHF
jgi:hypothetical protein